MVPVIPMGVLNYTPALGLIHGRQNGVAGAPGRAEKSGLGQTNQIQATNGPKPVRHFLAQPLGQ